MHEKISTERIIQETMQNVVDPEDIHAPQPEKISQAEVDTAVRNALKANQERRRENKLKRQSKAE